MSIYTETSIQPFIRVKNLLTPKEFEIKACNNSLCTSYSKANNQQSFCSSCGNKIETVTTSKNVSNRNDVFEYVVDELKERLMVINDENMKEKNFHTIISNQNSFADIPRSHFSQDCIVEIDMSKQMKDHTEWFKKHFEADIKALKSKFGDDNVTLHYGIVTYSM